MVKSASKKIKTPIAKKTTDTSTSNNIGFCKDKEEASKKPVDAKAKFFWFQTKFDWINLKLRHLDMRNKKAAASGVFAAIIIRKLLKVRKQKVNKKAGR